MIFRAGWLMRPDEQPVERGEVVVDAGGLVVRAGAACGRADEGEVQDFGPGSMIVPGLVNAHTHLELSHVSQPLEAGASFVEWLGRIVELNRTSSAEDRARGVAAGVRQSLAAGVSCVGDISYGGDGWPQLLGSPLRSTRFVEVFGHRAREVERRVRDDLAVLAGNGFCGCFTDTHKQTAACGWHPSNHGRWSTGGADHRAGLSPHAPYSAGVRAFMAARRAADERGLPVATHLHESREEIELYVSGGGGLRRWLPLKAMLALARFKAAGRSPIVTLAEAGFFDAPALVAHANYVDDADIAVLRGSGSSVVYCPRSHAHFGHPPHPVGRLLAAGVNVALGTDSLASSPSLSVLDEMRFLHGVRPEIGGASLLKMATSAGALALGRAGLVGRLAAGEAADMTVLRCAARAGDAYEALLDGRTRVEAVYVGGRVAGGEPRSE